MSIKAIALIQEEDDEKRFLSEITNKILEYEVKGYEVEIQYAMTTVPRSIDENKVWNYVVRSALIIGRA